MKKLNRVSFICIFVFSLIYSLEVFAEEALVISVIGQAWVRGAATEAWSPVVRGAMISDDQEVKFQKGSLIRAINSMGELKIVRDNGPASFARQAGNSSSGKVLETLSDFVSSSGRSKVAATRGIDGSATLRVQDDWIKYMKNPPTLEEIEDFLSLIYYYESNGRPHRRWALLQRLSATAGNFIGFSLLNNSFGELASAKLDWRVMVNSESESVQANEGEKVAEGDGIQITVQSDKEVFIYLFFTTHPDVGQVTTYKISPQNIAMVESASGEREFAGLLRPGDKLSLPNASQSYRLDANSGYEYVWGWACHGPVAHQDVIDDALSSIEAKLASTSSNISSLVEKERPGQCPYLFSKSLKHL